MKEYPFPIDEGRRDIVISIILTLVTCGVYGLYWWYKQMEAINAWLNREEYSFWMVLFLSVVTCGIYYIYIEYKMAVSINAIQQENGFNVNSSLPLICLLLAIFGLGIVSKAIQQSEMNDWYAGSGMPR